MIGNAKNFFYIFDEAWLDRTKHQTEEMYIWTKEEQDREMINETIRWMTKLRGWLTRLTDDQRD